MRANKHMVIDGENLVIENRIVGDPSKVDIDGIAMVFNTNTSRGNDEVKFCASPALSGSREATPFFGTPT